MYKQNDFKLASNRLVDFYRENRKKLNLAVIKSGSQEVSLANLLINAVIADEGNLKITSGWLCSDLTFASRLPSYLQAQGLIWHS